VSVKPLNIVDSSGWLEVLVDGPNAPAFMEVIANGDLIVPAITIFEVTKRARLLGTVADAQRIESHMRRFQVADLTADRASAAVVVSLKHKLPMADSLIYAAALEFNATVWTQDDDFEGLERVRYIAKPKT
jgi:predicted nucleic acid-binding protein